MIYDLCIIGGGVNGCGIARDAAMRGYKVLLLERNDLASATSSASSKIIHGGLRYLEYGEFRLVREALKEREVLLKIAPHIIWPLEFVLPHTPALRPAWMIQAGLFLYDHLAARKTLPAAKKINLHKHAAGQGFNSAFGTAFTYADCWVQDSRLVVLNAMDAVKHGAVIKNYCGMESVTALPDKGWKIAAGGQDYYAHMIVNAAGPWVDRVQKHLTPSPIHLRLVQGSHIIVPRLYDGPHAYILQQDDRRIVFAFPYEENFTYIGTTDTEYFGDPAGADITEGEKEYLLQAANNVFTKKITKSDIIHTYTGVRPLLDDGAAKARAITRDYKIVMSGGANHPCLSVVGGKITTYRTLSEKALHEINRTFEKDVLSRTAQTPLPGGDFDDFDSFLTQQTQKYEQLSPALVKRYARAYGTKMNDFCSSHMGEHYGDGVYEAEIDYLQNNEFAQTLDDILWRRSKLALHISPQTRNKLQERLS
ncbi:MAG: glycerol-3-phosphate dehydrogenase [Alphaproteobacteria bacterium]|nr:glycerol-3-phosphate dehydrogenase [Alphaproteobacteria bacterium]